MAEPRWHWRNCRSIVLRFDLFLWPWHLSARRDDDVFGGEMGVNFGPLAFTLYYGIGNSSSYGLERFTALSETEAYDRAEKWEAADA